jgi:hypothetical protein
MQTAEHPELRQIPANQAARRLAHVVSRRLQSATSLRAPEFHMLAQTSILMRRRS